MMASAAEHTVPRLLQGIDELPMAQLESHLEVHGPMADLWALAPTQIIDLAEQAGLRGRGGASFPAAKKMKAVARGRKPKVLVVNGSEGEPASKKDRVLLRELPHLVLDGAALAARAVGAQHAIVTFSERQERTDQSLEQALRERRDARLRDPKFELVPVPEHWLSGQETALVNVLNGGPVKPTFDTRPFEGGVDGRPTLVQNVETLAHLALISRHGADWFRRLGSDKVPGSALVTLSGSLTRPGVYEIDPGMGLEDLLGSAGVRSRLRAVLIGGYFGSWIGAGQLVGLTLGAEHLAAHGASLGAGVIVALDESACPVAETARVASYFAAQNAGQCGPCVNGLAAISYTVQSLAAGTAEERTRVDLVRWFSELPGRGACQHPTGAVRFVSSAVRVFAEEFADHALHGRCERCCVPSILPVPLVHA